MNPQDAVISAMMVSAFAGFVFGNIYGYFRLKTTNKNVDNHLRPWITRDVNRYILKGNKSLTRVGSLTYTVGWLALFSVLFCFANNTGIAAIYPIAFALSFTGGDSIHTFLLEEKINC